MSAALAVIALLVGGCAQMAPEPAASSENGRVANVADGDTLRLADGRRVRLVQIDAPERVGECFGEEARAALLALAPIGAEIRLEREPALDDRDRFGRLLRTVFVLRRNVNLALVERGAASPYFYRGERGRLADDLLGAARDARARRRGLWGACPIARLRPGRALASGPP